eukprot:TRINITY_DN1410_c0_g1_i2.p1 TRINITY_DN1410_c0_g1~~TRINITY_DN1410_c0_g1_i2.p1  ORF type:complete len:100 (-),score=5.82 TRINITY_DN1410_c0_g1_i2:369-668(-)
MNDDGLALGRCCRDGSFATVAARPASFDSAREERGYFVLVKQEQSGGNVCFMRIFEMPREGWCDRGTAGVAREATGECGALVLRSLLIAACVRLVIVGR